jgi:hypothetical protein
MRLTSITFMTLIILVEMLQIAAKVDTMNSKLEEVHSQLLDISRKLDAKDAGR